MTFFKFAFNILNFVLSVKKDFNVSALVYARQILFTGFDALVIVVLTSIVTGTLIIIQGNILFINFGQIDLLYSTLVILIIRELGVFIPALIVIARSGTAITTEIGNMIINYELDALLSMGINPITYLVIPRIIAVVVALTALTVYFQVFSILAAGITSKIFFNLSFSFFIQKFLSYVQIGDFILSQLKAVFFALNISLIACYQGLNVKSASTEVPQRTSKTVVEAIAGVIFLNVVFTLIFNFL